MADRDATERAPAGWPPPGLCRGRSDGWQAAALFPWYPRFAPGAPPGNGPARCDGCAPDRTGASRLRAFDATAGAAIVRLACRCGGVCRSAWARCVRRARFFRWRPLCAGLCPLDAAADQGDGRGQQSCPLCGHGAHSGRSCPVRAGAGCATAGQRPVAGAWPPAATNSTV